MAVHLDVSVEGLIQCVTGDGPLCSDVSKIQEKDMRNMAKGMILQFKINRFIMNYKTALNSMLLIQVI